MGRRAVVGRTVEAARRWYSHSFATFDVLKGDWATGDWASSARTGQTAQSAATIATQNARTCFMVDLDGFGSNWNWRSGCDEVTAP
jgi:hypothetical protein